VFNSDREYRERAYINVGTIFLLECCGLPATSESKFIHLENGGNKFYKLMKE
jgi:hypothetical protein